MAEHIGITKYAPTKAVVGAIATGVLALLTALAVVVTGDATLADVTQAQWITVAIAVLASSGITGTTVYNTVNKPLT